MNQSFLRWTALVCTSATLALTSAGAFAQASIQLSDPNCADFTIGGTAGARTLTCVQSTTPLCTINAPTAGTIGTAIAVNTTLCVPAANSYLWAGGNCAGQTTKNCSDPGTGYTNGQVVNYSMTGTNGAGAGPASNTVTVTWTTTPPAAPSGCSISGAPATSQSAGYMATLTMNCTAGGQATSWAWTGGGAQSATTQTVGPFVVNQTTTFTATASNVTGTSAPASATITIGSGGGGAISCNGFPGGTLAVVMPYDDPNGGFATYTYTDQDGGFPANGALVVQFTTPAIATPPTSGQGFIALAEYGGPTALRKGSLSATPCDFTGGIGGFGVFNGTGPTIAFTVDFTSKGSPPIELQPNTTYYLNVENPLGCSPGPTCDVKVTLTKQPGT